MVHYSLFHPAFFPNVILNSKIWWSQWLVDHPYAVPRELMHATCTVSIVLHAAWDSISSFILLCLHSDAAPNEGSWLCIHPLYYSIGLKPILTLSSPLLAMTVHSYYTCCILQLISFAFLWPASCTDCKLQNHTQSFKFVMIKNHLCALALFFLRRNYYINPTVNRTR